MKNAKIGERTKGRVGEKEKARGEAHPNTTHLVSQGHDSWRRHGAAPLLLTATVRHHQTVPQHTLQQHLDALPHAATPATVQLVKHLVHLSRNTQGGGRR